jgi:RNA polymerase sigma-70 factor (ECF subfamily)
MPVRRGKSPQEDLNGDEANSVTFCSPTRLYSNMHDLQRQAVDVMTSTQGGAWSADVSREEASMMETARADITRFAPLYERYAARIYAYCLRRVKNREDAEDLTSLIFTHALNGLPGYQGGSVAAWLFRIAHNNVVSHYRKQRPVMVLESFDTGLEIPDLIENLMLHETKRDIRAFVVQLSEAEQELIALKVTAGLSAEEIGKVLGKSAGAVRVEYHRIIKRLRTHFQQEESVE